MISAPIQDMTAMFAGLNASSKMPQTGSENTDAFSAILGNVANGSEENMDISEKMRNVTRTIDQERADIVNTSSSAKTDNSQVRGDSDKNIADKLSDKKAVDTNVSNQAASEEVTEVTIEQAANTVDNIIAKTAEVLGISEDDLKEVLENLGLTAMDLANPQNVSMLVATVKADGDMMSLVTDEALTELVSEINEVVTSTLEEVSEELGIDIGELTAKLEEAIETQKNDVVTENVTPAANTNTEEVNAFDQEVKDFTAKEVVSDDKAVVNVATTNQTNDTSDDAGESLADSKNQDQSLTFTKNDKHESVKDNSVHNEAQANTFNANVNNLNPQEVSVAPLGDNTQSLSSTQLDVINQINEYMKTQIKADMSTLEMQLNPANLGAVNVALSSKDGNVTAQFTTQSELVKAALESQIMILKENLEQAGVKVNAVEVSVESHAFERNLDEQGQNNGQEAKEEEEKRLRKATRRLNINDLFADDNSVELSEEESLTAEMMQADGNVMDYKA